jgi:hypothetical protein
MGIKLSVDQPTLEEMLADPIVTLVMSSDKVTEAEIRGILRKVAAHRRPVYPNPGKIEMSVN